MTTTVHSHIQADILLALSETPGAHFAELNRQKVSSDQFSYHLRRLIKYKFIDKDKEGRYYLSPGGANLCVQLDTKTKMKIDQAFIAVRSVLVRVIGGEEHYLVQRRTRAPFLGKLSTPGGKIMRGENVVEAMERCIKFETGLDAEFVPCGILHLIDSVGDNEVMDKYFFVVRGDKVSGDLERSGYTGDNIWMTYQQIVDDPNRHGGLLEVINTARGTHPWFGEYRYP